MDPKVQNLGKAKSGKLLPVYIVGLLMAIVLLYLTVFPPCFFYGRMSDELKDSELFDDMASGKSFCFLGDSISAGTETKGISWHHHLDQYIEGSISEISRSGWTSDSLVEVMEDIPAADVYVIAIGINDVIFCDQGYGAPSAEEYTDTLEILADHLKNISPDARFYFITPWIFFGFPEDIQARRIEYSDALAVWCKDEGYICIDPNPIIGSVIEKKGQKRYMYNDFHPNARRGVGLFSYAVLMTEHQRRVESL